MAAFPKFNMFTRLTVVALSLTLALTDYKLENTHKGTLELRIGNLLL